MRSRTITREIPLTTRARHGAIGEPAQERAAFVRFYSDHPDRPLLQIAGMPAATWYLSTLLGVDSYNGHKLELPGDTLAVDHGQRRVLFNVRELVSEALARVLGEDPPPPGACTTCKGAGGKCIMCNGTGKAQS